MEHLYTLNKHYKVNANKFVQKIGKNILKIAQADTNVRTGRAKRSWKYKKAISNGKYTSITVYNTSPIIHLLEDGHIVKNRDGQIKGYKEGYHMLKNAIKQAEDRIESDFEQEFFK